MSGPFIRPVSPVLSVTLARLDIGGPTAAIDLDDVPGRLPLMPCRAFAGVANLGAANGAVRLADVSARQPGAAPPGPDRTNPRHEPLRTTVVKVTREVLGRWLDTALDRSVICGYTRFGLAMRRRLPGWPEDPAPGVLAGRTVLVTGAGSGLGVATADAFARLGAVVHLVVRDLVSGKRVAAAIDGDVRVSRCDVSDPDDVRRFAESAGAVDVLVHNAGVLPASRSTTPQGHEVALATHVLGPLLMTELLQPLERVIFVSSGGMYAQKLPLGDPGYRHGAYRGAAAYARTKRIQVALVPLLARRWPDTTVAAMHPGWADTPGIAGSLPGFHRLAKPFLRDTDEGADTTVWLGAVRPAPASGLFWHDRRPRSPHLVPWTRHSDADSRAMLDWCLAAAGL
jgi:NAD(P)-dependent dehydrogenase (short-subunit alcohol dehydrogenase family)